MGDLRERNHQEPLGRRRQHGGLAELLPDLDVHCLRRNESLNAVGVDSWACLKMRCRSPTACGAHAGAGVTRAIPGGDWRRSGVNSAILEGGS